MNSQALDTLKRRVLQSLLPAVIGGALGYLYAFQTLNAEELRQSHLAGLYSAVGAGMGILALRLGTLLKMVITDFWRRD